jgi:hypothetical protein
MTPMHETQCADLAECCGSEEASQVNADMGQKERTARFGAVASVPERR